MKFGLSELTTKTPLWVFKLIQFSAALGAALVAFFAAVEFPAATEAIVMKIYTGIAAAIAIIGQFFGIDMDPLEDYLKKK